MTPRTASHDAANGHGDDHGDGDNITEVNGGDAAATRR